MSGYVARPDTWVSSGRGLVGASESLESAVNALCHVLAGAGACWGNDEIGRAFFDGDGQAPGYGVSRDEVLAALADMVNVVRATGGLLIVSGRTYAVAEEAGDVGSALPPGADVGALAAEDPYRLPAVTAGFAESDPPPSGLVAMLRFVESLVGGCAWPDGSVAGLSAVVRAWRAAGYAAGLVAEDVAGHARAVTSNNAGEATQRFGSFADALRGGGDEGGLLWLTTACTGLADSVENLIRQKEAARFQFALSLDFLLATWALAMGLSVITGGGSVAAATATSEAEGMTLKAFLRMVVKSVLAGAWYSGGLDAAGQYARIEYGLAKGFDAGEFFTAVGEGAVAGGVMGVAGGWVGRRGNALTTTLSGAMRSPGLKGAGARFFFAGTTGTAGNVAAQAAFDKGHVDWVQAAQFGFGMAGIEVVKETGRHTAAGLTGPAHPGSTEPAAAPGETPPGRTPGSETAAGRASGRPPSAAGHIPAGEGTVPARSQGAESTQAAAEGTGRQGDHTTVRTPRTDLATTGTSDLTTPHTTADPVGTVHPDAAAITSRAPDRASGDPVVTPSYDPGAAAARPRSTIAELLGPSHRSRATVPARPGDETALTASAEPGETALVSPAPPSDLHPPRYVEMGALGETAVHSVELPADPRAAAQRWVDGLPPDLDPRVTAEIKDWLTERLADGDRENWTDLLQKGAAFSVGDTVIYLKPDLRDFSRTEAPEGPRDYPVSFGGDGVERREFGAREAEVTGGAVEIYDSSDEVETLGLPGLGVKTSTRMSDAGGLDVMSGRKTVAYKHDFFDTKISFKVFRDGTEVPYGARVPDLSLVIPFPEEFHRVGPLGVGDGPPLAPRHEVTPDAARRIPDHGVLVTAVETTPLALELQRRALAAGVPSHEVVRILDDLLSTVHSEQGLKNRSQWWLTSGSASEGIRYETSRLRSSEDSFRITSSVLRMEHVHESNTVPIETRVRDDLGRRTDTVETSQSGSALNAWVGVKLGLGSVDKVFARIGGSIRVGKIHLTSTSHMDLPKVTLIRTTEITRYDALVRLHVASEKLGVFDVDVRMEMALPAADAGRFERDVLGTDPPRELSPDPATPKEGFARLREDLADLRQELAHVREDLAHAHGALTGTPVPHPAYEPHPREPVMLAAGRGPGLGTLARLPRSEQLVTGLREAVTRAVPDLPPKVLRQVLRELDAGFGRPALEADLTNLLNGIDYRTTAGRYRIEVSARGTLGALRGVEEYPMTVNERRVTGAGVNTGWTSSAGGGLEAAANARVKVGKVFGIDFPKASVDLNGAISKRTAFASGYTVYYRTETDGPVTAFTRAAPIDVELRITRGGKEVTDASWRVDDSTAEIVVPQQHVPREAVSADDAAAVGRMTSLDARPDDVLHLGGRIAGIVRLGAMPDLGVELGRAHADWLGQPPPEARREVPAEILDLTRPSYLEANLGSLMSTDGKTIKLPDHDGWHQALRLKVDAAGLEHTGSGPGVEYEQYTNANSRVLTGKSSRTGVAAHAQVGARAGLHGSGENEHKVVATAGGSLATGRGSGESAYEGGMDVARGTYGSDAHWYRGDMVVEATPIRWKGSDVEEGPATRLRVQQIMDLVAPDQVARHLGLDGPSPDVTPVTEHRAYVEPELAMTSAYVEHLDAAKVLPEIVEAFHEEGILFRGEERTASPVMEVLRARYGDEAMSASLVALRDGVITWLPVKRAYGFTDYVGVRVKAVVADGAHTSERPDVRLMLRSEHLSGSGTVHEKTSGGGAKALARYTKYSDSDVGGGELAVGRITESSSADTGSTDVKEINRVQTYDPSHEFTHPVRYEIEVVRSHEPPPGLAHLRGGTRGALRKFAELTGNDAAGRHWDENRRISTRTRTADGAIRMIVPEHLTTIVPEHTPVTAQTPVVGEAPRWSAPVSPLEVNQTLRKVANQVAVPAAPLVGQWGPVAALPPKLRGPVPLLADRPLGYEIGLPRGMDLGEAGNPRTMRAQLKALLAHEHTIPGLGGERVRVGINVHRATRVTEASVKQRVYEQTRTTSGHGQGHSTDRTGRGGVSAGPPSPGTQGTAGTGGGRGSGGEMASRNSNIRERNEEMSTENGYYRCAISLVFHGPGRDLVLDVPEGLYIRLSPDGVDRLEREHPGFITPA
ncbi:MAG: hypothetical protein JWP48_7131 [Actinoallomurus sp.]|nr:hypothetical protein [Actinoallomurus sp.]